VIEDGEKPLAALRAENIEVIAGNAAKAEVLQAANLEGAKRLIVAIPNAFEAGQSVQRARMANPGLAIIARAHSDAEVDYLAKLGADTVIMGEREIALAIVSEVKNAELAEGAIFGAQRKAAQSETGYTARDNDSGKSSDDRSEA
jgi:CPA2 family monovalent cation:H+ antiporter-2